LFFNSQSEIEKMHIVRAFRFELTKVQTVAVRERVVAQLRNVDEKLAAAVADGLGMTQLPQPLPKLLKRGAKPEVQSSAALSLLARPGSQGIMTRRIAIMVANGVDDAAALAIHEALAAQGAVPRFIGVKLGKVQGVSGNTLDIEISLETAPSVVWDAMIVPDGQAAAEDLAARGQALEFLKDQYRHCKPILLFGAARELLGAAGIPAELPSGEADEGLLQFDDEELNGAIAEFVAALTRHRHFERETDPPRV
jgi:catalase